MRKTILVTGATGKQGSSVVDFLLKDGTFNVRCLLRNIDSSASKTLFNQGVQVVKGDLENVDSLVQAMDGCYGVFGVTNFWDPATGYEGEIRQGKNLGKACKRAGVQHLVYSTLDYNSDVPHFESKVLAEEYMKKCVPTTGVVTSFYFENFASFFPPKEENGELVFTVAQKSTTRVPMYAVSDTGGWVLQAFLHPELYLNKDVPAVGQYITYPELVATFSRVTGKKARFNELPLDVFRGFGFPGAEELAQNLKFFDDITDGNKDDRRGDLETSQNIFKGRDWENYLKTTGWSG